MCISDLPSACQHSSSSNICQKTQKQAVRYHCRSHGNGPAEGVPAPTLMCTNSVQADSPACRTHRVRRGAVQEPGPLGEPCYRCAQLVCLICEKCHKGRRGMTISEMMSLQCSFAHFLSFNKHHTFPAAGAALGLLSCSSKWQKNPRTLTEQ